MADQPGQEAKNTGQETIFNSGIGDDWGEAFEAEDFMAAPSEETGTEFFLPDEATESTILSIPVKGAQKAKPVVVFPPGLLAGLSNSLFARLWTIPLPLRLVAVVIPVLALILILTLRGKAPEQMAPSPAAQPKMVVVPQPEVEEPATHPPEPEAKVEVQAPAIHPPEQQAVLESHQAAPEENTLKSTPLKPKELRKKWRFPAIIVHAKTDKDHAPAILSIDLTLVLRLAPEIMPPADKESFIREILYQFYTNQPVDDLQRYALDRGEMHRKLQAWIMKQWPELSLDSIAIDRYQLL